MEYKFPLGGHFYNHAVGLGLALTNTVVVFEHPVDELVTVKEYTPAAFTVAEAVVAPAVMPAPDQL